MTWSPQQQAMLSAMGYTVYRQAGVESSAASDSPVAQVSPVAAATAGKTSNPGTAHAQRAASKADRLLQALVRAAGGRDASELPLPPLDQLRASAAAKRALWPALRALRRQH